MDGEQQLGPPQRTFRKDLIAMFGAHIVRLGIADGFFRPVNSFAAALAKPVAKTAAALPVAPVIGWGAPYELA